MIRRAFPRLAPSIITAVAILGASACGGEATAPRRLTGTYVAQTANGGPLPVHTCTVLAFLRPDSIFVTEASLEFMAPDSVRFVDVLRVTPDTTRFASISTRRYSVRGQTVLMFEPGATGGQAAVEDSLLIRGDALRRTVACNGVGPATGPVTFDYRR